MNLLKFACAGTLAVFSSGCLFAQLTPVTPDVAQLKIRNVKAEAVTFLGKKAVRITDIAPDSQPNGDRFAVLPGTDFENGVIEVDLAGETLPNADESARAFTGISFRMSSDGSKYEAFYVRPKNGRSEDQLQRNHSAQYVSEPEFPWQRLRKETPGKYESYVDIVPGAWIKVRIEVRGLQAKLFVSGAEQPTLLVSDMKHGLSKGSVALWIGPGTVAHFANLRITRQE